LLEAVHAAAERAAGHRADRSCSTCDRTEGEQSAQRSRHRARLLHYSGSGLSSAEPIELRFNLQGALELAKSGNGTVPPEEISAIRERAQLLRSHALAQKSTQDHH